MERVFLNVLNMSITGSYVILFVLVARILLKKASKIFSYSLWSVVLFRLICPFSFSSTLSFLKFVKSDTMEHIPADIGYMAQPRVNAGIDAVDNWANNSLPAATSATSVNPMQMIIFTLSLLWIIGAIGLLTYCVVSYVLLKRKVSTAILITDNIFESEKIISPFVLGIIRPKIYLPMSLDENERGYILMHEKIHIKRFDYLIKPFAFLILCFHWFNPLVWMSFVLMSNDMEMSCDERVLKEMGRNIKKDYSNSLLALATHKKLINGSPLALGESNVKSRIKNVLNYKKPTFWVLVVSIIMVSMMGIGLTANPKNHYGDLSFLNINNTASIATQREQLLIRIHDSRGTIISGNEFGKFLETTSSNWIKEDADPPYENSPTITVYIDIGSDHKVHFYKSEPELAMVQFDGKYRYYKVPEDTYEKVFMMYAIRSYAVQEEIMKAITDGKKTNLQSVQDAPNNGDYQILKVGNENYFIYKKGSKYYVEQPYVFIREITEKVYKDAVNFATSPTANDNEVSAEIKSLVEDNIVNIMSSPLQSSNPSDYIKANDKAYESILKYGGENALSYMLSEFQKGYIKDDLHGQIMMLLCIEFLGDRNNVTDKTLSPNEWFNKLSIRQKVELPDLSYDGDDLIQKLVYSTEIEKNKSDRGSFTIVAPHIFGSYEEGNKLKVFATTFSKHYILYDKTLSDEGGSIIPVAITYVKNSDGNYVLEKYEQARDGSEFAKSIREFCIMPLTGKKISNLADKMLKHYGNYNDIINLERENLIQHLKKNNQVGVFFHQQHYQLPDELIPLT
jgi:beta-lactamase regulating signal transducer with metallopeptidase domain